MTAKAPHVYIDGRRMEDTADSNHPVLAGLSLNFGTDSDLEFSGGDTATLSILVKEPEFLGFLQLGLEVAVYHEPARGAPETDFTYLAGRIQRMSGDPHPTIDGALLLTLECADLTTDLAALQALKVNSASPTASVRLSALNQWLPAPWKLNGWIRWPDLKHAALVFEKIPVLELIDRFARAQILRRRNSSYFKPGTGITRQITLLEDNTKNVRADQLTHFAGSRRWGITPGRPYGDGSLVMNLDGKDIHRAAGWVKEPEDVITEVVLEMISDPVWNAAENRYEDVGTFDRSSADVPALGTAELKARLGHRQTSFATDLGTDVTSTHFGEVMRHWLSDSSEWRPGELSLVNTDSLTMAQIGLLLAPTSRYSVYATVRNVMANRPDAGNYWIRGFVIGGSASWDGKDWDISLRLGRPPKVSPGMGNWWTLARLAASAEFGDATCASVGTALTVRDFERIGEPT